jgi:type I restriction-modification system DNA methylase subunit/restriction endonuclease S subunit
MITKDNLRILLTCLGFQKSETIQDEMNLHFDNINCTIAVDFTNEKIIYPEGVEADRDTTKNFSANENFVVLECVVGLFAQGYKPENIVLEPKTPGGREDSHFYCDILIRDNDKRPYMLIECKTMDGKEDDEFNKAWKKTLLDGDQLFNYYNTYRQAQYLVLYASDLVDDKPHKNYHLITMTDNEEYLESNPQLLSFKKVSADNGTRDDFFKVWSETYGKDDATNGAFEVDEVPAFGVTKKKLTIDNLIIVNGQDIQRKYHQFAQTLRQYNVASHENAFDKLVNLFLVKVVDEVRNPKDLQFLWKGAAYDDYYSFQDRLQKLYQIGMKDYLGEDVTYIDNASIENAFRMQKNDPDAIKDTILEYFRQLKFYSNSDFGFLDVHNKQLFVQNAVILKAMVEMLQDMRLKTEQQNQFLGDLFEGFLDQGVKQNEGQFFTPTPITRFMVSSLPLEQIIRDNTDIPKAIDYACGAGHFLNEYASQIMPFVKQYKGAQSLPDYYKQIYGIEKEYRLSKVSKISSFMYGQDGIQIVYGDALVHHDTIKDGEYKVLIANPPYSVTGFLATLTKEQRNAYVLSADVDSKQLETNNSIETFFIERAKQLLAPDGVAAIILPSSILSNSSNIYIKTREILLQYFDFVAIAEFGSGTFGKTGTNTVVLFLRRKKSEPELATHYRNRVKAWFSNNHGQDYRYDDADVIKRYANHIRVPYEDYKTLFDDKPSEGLMKHEIFAAYKSAFSDNTAARKIKKKQNNPDTDKELEKHILDSIRNVEKDKLYYFMLCESNPQHVIVVKSPIKTAETKKFLGYEWSNRKGSEGIKYLGAIVEEDDNDISANKGIQQIQTPLFDPQNLFNDEKINTLIRKNYLGEDAEWSEDVGEYVDPYQLKDMLDFKRVDFDKAIKTTPILVYPKIECKEGTDIKKLSVVAPYVTTSIKMSSISVADYISTDNMLQNRAGVVAYNGVPNIDSITEFKKEDILVSNIRPYLKKIWMADRNGGCSKDVLVFRNSKPREILNDYLMIIMSTDIFFDYMMVGKKGVKMPRGDKKIIPNFEIPIPSLDIQKKIADECKKVDEDSEKSKSIIFRNSKKITEIINTATGTYNKIMAECEINTETINPSTNPDKKYIYIDIDAVENGTGLIDTTKYVLGRTAPSRARRLAHAQSTIISTVRPHLKGFTFIEEEIENSVFSTGFAILTSKDVAKLPNKMIYYQFMYSDRLMNQIIAAMPKGSYPSINCDNIENFEILTDVVNVDKMLTKLNNLDKEIKDARFSISHSIDAKQAILDKYLKQ